MLLKLTQLNQRAHKIKNFINYFQSLNATTITWSKISPIKSYQLCNKKLNVTAIQVDLVIRGLFICEFAYPQM